jgi:hypothetical protein
MNANCRRLHSINTVTLSDFAFGIKWGQENPSVAALSRIAHALGVRPADLLKEPSPTR